ncbi:putative ATP-dependent RNA helicase [Cotonvirus japonicus]|uniref:ATP-dependent RNA helicase n=1 Tax=Cotonvirus japonicus TaxID=2811091 RepID=A0ABM7NT35_9VIRU|nr:putative ATP-dependent RNA helicase [Cotonvirus japonicus]BCS83340.1 putative ATP-dependent RNA helicase [Cotonvirus japonicus]
MSNHLNFSDKIGILDPKGINLNPLNNEPYSDRYKSLAQTWSTYPAYLNADKILDAISDNQVVFLIIGTGGAKTLIAPKLALHYTNYEGVIAVTLPKKIITLSAATYSAEISDIELGTSIGYVYKGDKKTINDENKLIYMTDGYLVMEFVRDPLLSKYKIIIIDEAHERRVQIDLLMLFLKNILRSGKRPDLKVIIMSATIDGEKYQQYFNGVTSTIVSVSGQPNHPIDVHFLDKPATSYMKDGLELIEDLIHREIKKDMLFFITTSSEALQLCRTIRPKYPRVYCVEVYSDMDKNLKIYATSSEEYLKLGNYDQKLVMATNVAESSLTIDGLEYVIDSGYELYSRFDPKCYGQVLEKRLITKAQALQRRGRVGRIRPGVCYHLLTKQEFNDLEDYPTPDILRQDITMDIIKITQITESKTLDESLDMLNQLMDPPKKSFVDSAINILESYNIINANNILTKTGSIITQFSSLPINRVLFLIYAFELQCAREASIIISMIEILNGKVVNLFYKSDTICESNCEKQSAQQLVNKLAQKRGDHFTFLKIYQEFNDAPDQKAWARKYGVRLETLYNIKNTANQYFYKVLNASRTPPMSRISTTDAKTNILQALKRSHHHLTASKLKPVTCDITGSISRDSMVNQTYKRKDLINKTFIYDELTNVNGKWEFKTITII